MPRASALQPSFNQGEWSPLTYGRADIQQRAKAMQLCRDFQPTIQGPLVRRSGTWYVAAAGASVVRLQKFQFNTTQAYVLEFGHGFIHFYVNGGQLLSGGVTYEVATNYTLAELDGLNFTQSGDVLYIVHPAHPPATLKRLGATNWVLSNITFQDGPYLTQNSADTYAQCTVTHVGDVGTFSTSNTIGVNGGAGFQASDVGRLIRIQNTRWSSASTSDPQKWIQLLIIGVTNATAVSVTVVGVVPQ